MTLNAAQAIVALLQAHASVRGFVGDERSPTIEAKKMISTRCQRLLNRFA